MAHGFRARNGNNIVTIDYQFANMGLYSKGTVTTVASAWTRFGWYSQTFVVYGATQGFLACCGPKFVQFFLTGQQVVAGGGIQYTMVTKGPATMEWFAFAPPTDNPGGIGLRIVDPLTGKVHFNSGRKYMKVLDVNQGQHMWPMDPNTGWSANPIDNPGGYRVAYGGKKVAVIQGIFAHEFRFDIFNDYEGFEVTEILTYECWHDNGQTGTMVMHWDSMIGVEGPFDPGSVNHNNVQQWYYSAMTVDVTGF